MERPCAGAKKVPFAAAILEPGQRFQRFRRTDRAAAGIFFQEPQNPLFELGRDVAAQLAHGIKGPLQVSVDQFRDIGRVEGRVARHRLVKDAAEGIEIGPAVDRLPLELFGRHVMDRAHERIEMVHRLRLGRIEIFGQPKIEDLHLERIAFRDMSDHEIARLEIAVDEAEGVRGENALEALLGEAAKILELKRTAVENRFHRFALDQLHHDIGPVGIDPVIEDGDDVRMLQTGRGHGLAPRLFRQPAIILGDLHADPLDRDGTSQMMVPSPENVAETAGADLVLQLETVGDPGLGGRVGGGLRVTHSIGTRGLAGIEPEAPYRCDAPK
jgi:hypothetical protein